MVPIASALSVTPALAQCKVLVQHARLKDVVVSVPGVSFSLNLADVPLDIELAADQAAARVRVLGPLRFEVTYPVHELAFRIDKRVQLFGGRIRLGQGAAPMLVGVRGNGMQLSLHSMLGVNVRPPLEIPCANVGLSDGTPYATPAAMLPSRAQTIGTGTGFFPLHLSPSEGNPLYVQYTGPFEILDRRPGWILLSAAWADGTRVRGWTPERYVTPETDPVSGWGEGVSGVLECARSDVPLLDKRTLRAGGRVAVSPGGPVWARVAEPVEVEIFPPRRADGWIQVARVPGVVGGPCMDPDYVWVHAHDIIGAPAATVGGR